MSNQIKSARESRNLNLRDFTGLIGVSKSTAYRWEHLEVLPSRGYLKLIEKRLAVTIDRNKLEAEFELAERNRKIKAQDQLIEKRGLKNHHKVPRNCFFCHKSPYDSYTVDYCANNLITGCRICKTSFCD